MPTFVCVGDLHLGAGSDYGRVPGERLAEQEAIWAKACRLVNELEADGMIFVGDAFERRRPSPAEMMAFARPLMRVEDVVAIPGNHDLPGLTGAAAIDVFDHGDLEDGDFEVQRAMLLDLYRAPRVIFRAGCLISLLPWAPVSNLVAAASGGDRDALNFEASQELLKIARGLYAEAKERRELAGMYAMSDRADDPPIILVTHFAIEGGVTPTGVDAHVFREPVLPLGELEAIGFDAIVAGHIHKPQRLDKSGRPLFYVGSPMPLNFGEASCDHGVWLLTTPESGMPARANFVPFESRPFITVDASGAAVEASGGPESGFDDAIVKIRIRASEEEARRIDVAALRRQFEAAGAHHVWAVQMEIERAERRKADVDETLGEEQALRLYLEEQGAGPIEPIIDRTLTYLEEVRP